MSALWEPGESILPRPPDPSVTDEDFQEAAEGTTPTDKAE